MQSEYTTGAMSLVIHDDTIQSNQSLLHSCLLTHIQPDKNPK